MKFSDVFASKDNIHLDKKTLVILRWIVIVGQLLTVEVVYFLLEFEFPFFYCLVIILFSVLTNIFLHIRIKENQLSNFVSSNFLLYDLIQLAVLLYFTGGITNPFTILLIIPAIVSSTFLNLKSTLYLSFVTIIILLILTLYHLPLPHPGDLHFHVPNYYLYAIPTAVIIGLVFLTILEQGLEGNKEKELKH
jgi:two-component system sensor histidine kinase RegB